LLYNAEQQIKEREFYFMEKKEREQLDKLIKERGTLFLNDTINMRGDIDEICNKFQQDIIAIDKTKAVDIVGKYLTIEAKILRTFALYKDNIDSFSNSVLQINSVISSSLTIEYRINDILFNIDTKKLNYSCDDLINKLEKLKNQTTDIDNLKEIEAVLDEAIQYLTNNKKRIQELKNSEYYIKTMSKDKNLIFLFSSILFYYVSNDVLEGIRKHLLKKYNVKIEDKTPKDEKIHCLKVGAYKITKNKIIDLMRLSLLNEGKNVIDKKALDIFNIFIDLENQTKTKIYKETLKKHIKVVSDDIEKNETKDLTLYVMDETMQLLQEMRWCNFEKK
jgi:hypothetical protein